MERLSNLNLKERRKLAKIRKPKKLKSEKGKASQPRQVWEFENYIKERLRATGIIQ